MILAFIQIFIKIGPNKCPRIYCHIRGLLCPRMTFEAILHFIKKLRLYNVGIFFKRLGVKQKIYRKKGDFDYINYVTFHDL